MSPTLGGDEKVLGNPKHKLASLPTESLPPRRKARQAVLLYLAQAELIHQELDIRIELDELLERRCLGLDFLEVVGNVVALLLVLSWGVLLKVIEELHLYSHRLHHRHLLTPVVRRPEVGEEDDLSPLQRTETTSLEASMLTARRQPQILGQVVRGDECRLLTLDEGDGFRPFLG